MGRSLTLDVPEEIFRSLDEAARAEGRSLQDWAVDILRSRVPPAGRRDNGDDAALAEFLKHLGTIAVGDPDGADNEAIDRDLAEEYGATHEAD